MRVTVEKNKICKFGELNPGDVFRFSDPEYSNIYIVTNNSNRGAIDNALNMDSMELTSFDHEFPVIKALDAELIVRF